MERPEQDVDDRLPVWDSLQHLFMDTDVSLNYDFIIRNCAASKYSLRELDKILYNEILPAIRFNMLMLPAPEWAGFETEWLKERVLKKHRFGRRRPWFLRLYTYSHWRKVRPKIALMRNQNAGSNDKSGAT